MPISRCFHVFLAATTAGALLAPPVRAQSAQAASSDTPMATPSASSAEPQGATESDIIVTAQRRSERLQNVPIAITAVTPERAEQLNLRDIPSLQQVTPGLIYTTGISYAQTYIRGIGSSFTNPGLEPAVATYIDGAYLERGFGSAFDIVDPANMQVLKGPQGTLWGRNATGGAILINTADPEDMFGAHITGEIGNLDHQYLEGMVNTPLSDTLSARFVARYRSDGGYIRNLVDGFMFGARRNWTVRGKLAYRPTGNFSAVAEVQYDNTRRTPGANAEFLPEAFCAFCSQSSYRQPVTDPYTTVGNVLNNGVGGRDKSTFLNLKMKYDAGTVSFDSVTAYRDTSNVELGDFDFTEIDGFNIYQKSGAKTFTQDITATTALDGIFNMVAGLSYLNDRSNFAIGFPPASAFPNPVPATRNTVTTQSYSGFAEATITPLPRVKLVVGGRYTHDARTLTGIDSRSFNSFTPRAVVSYDTGPVNLYLSYNQGFKAGGFNTPAAGPPANFVLPEKIRSYEAGVKFVSSDHRLRANLAAFTYDYKDLQVTAVDQQSGGSVLQNAASATGRGFEFDADYRPVSALQLFGGLTYLDAHYKDFRNAQVQVPTYDANGRPTGLAVGFEDLSGFPLARAPKWSGFLGATVTGDIGNDWKAALTGFANRTSSYDFAPGGGGPLRADRQPAFTLAKMNFRVMPKDERFEIGFFVDNLLNARYYDFRFTTAPFGGMQIVARPRTYFVRIGVKL